MGWLYPWRRDLSTVARTLCKFMVHTSNEVDELAKRVDALEQQAHQARSEAELALQRALSTSDAKLSPFQVRQVIKAVRLTGEINRALDSVNLEMKGGDHESV